jgi:hypothetical protein
MVKYTDRSNNSINWSNISVATFDPAEIASGIYGVDNIIDIMFLGRQGECVSVSPAKFKKWYGSYTNTPQTTSWYPGHWDDHYEPIGFRHLTRGDMNELCPLAITNGLGAWQNNDNAGRWLSGYNLSLAMLLDPSTENDSRTTEFFTLYNMMDELSDMVGSYGYKLFRPEQLSHYQNWAGYSSSEKYYNYMMVAYLTLPDLLQNLAFLRGPDIPASLKSLVNRANDSTISLVSDTCSAEFPSSSILKAGTYYTGTAIYSSNSEYKFVVKPDGNCMVTKYDGSITWQSDTRDPRYSLPKIVIGTDGSMVIAGTRAKAVSKTLIPSIGQSGFLHLDRVALVMRDTTYNIIRWTYITPTDQSAYDNANTIKIYNTFTPNTQYKASANTIKYSPSMSHYLIFTSDGVLELHQTATTYPVRKDTILWDTSALTKGRPNAILAIQSDSNIVIYDNGSPIWSIGNHNNTGPVFLVADDNGYAVAYNANGYKGSYKPPVWINVATSGVAAKYNNVATLYNYMHSGMQTNAIGTAPQSYTRACTTATYGKPLDAAAISMAQARYCASGLNLLTDSKCSSFMDEANNNATTKGGFDNYIIPKAKLLCADGYDSMYPDDPAIQKRVNDFCSCMNPKGNSLTIMGLGLAPICYDQKCVDSGYKTANTNNLRATCPKSVCIQPINLVNLQKVSGLTISCNIGGDPKPPDTPATPATPIPVAPVSTNPANVAIAFEEANVFTDKAVYAASADTVRPSPNGKYNLIFQADGNLVLYAADATKKALWSSGTWGNPLAVLIVQPDGTINIYRDSSKAISIWTNGLSNAPSATQSLGTNGRTTTTTTATSSYTSDTTTNIDSGGPSILAPDNNGNVVVYQSTAKGWVATWSSMGLAKYTPNSSITVTIVSPPEPKRDDSSSGMSPEAIVGIVGTIITICMILLYFLLRKSSTMRVQQPMYQYIQPQQQPIYPPMQPIYPPMQQMHPQMHPIQPIRPAQQPAAPYGVPVQPVQSIYPAATLVPDISFRPKT